MKIFNKDTLANNWANLNLTDKSQLNIDFLNAHHACQYVAIIGKNFVKAQPDDSHTNMGWLDTKQTMIGHSIQSTNGIKVGIRFNDLQLLIINDQNEIISNLELIGKSKDDGFSWLKENLNQLGINTGKLNTELHYEIPELPAENNSHFKIINNKNLTEISNLYQNANAVLKQIQQNLPNAGDARCWPHHFDIASLIVLENDSDGQMAKTMGVGFAPADSYVPEPYYYINLWSKEAYKYDKLPELNGGYWNDKDWLGSILKSSEFSGYQDVGEQIRTVCDFIESANLGVRQLLSL